MSDTPVGTPPDSGSAWYTLPAEPEPVRSSPPRPQATLIAKGEKKGHGLLTGVLVGLLVVAFGAAVWFGVSRLEKTSSPSATTAGAATAASVSQSGLTTIAGALGRPIYWAGKQSQSRYELTLAPDGRTYVRYLPKGVGVGTLAPYLTIGTYPFVNAFAASTAFAHQKGSVIVPSPVGSIAFYRTAHPLSVFVAYPGSDFQIEVFDPTPGKSKSLVSAGAIATVVPTSSTTASSTQGTAVISSAASMVALSKKLGFPIYWAGNISGTSDELTQTPDGRVYVRYLPPGVAPGSSTPYLTIATYPVKNAFGTTQAAMKRTDIVKVPMSGGGIAFFVKSHPTSVYLAFPGTNQQIEVFDPSASRARQLVTSQKIHPVS